MGKAFRHGMTAPGAYGLTVVAAAWPGLRTGRREQVLVR
jgi:hypothetical protein